MIPTVPPEERTTIVRCLYADCHHRFFDHALALGSVIDIKCKCNRKYYVVMTTLGVMVAEKKNVTYTPNLEAVTGPP